MKQFKKKIMGLLLLIYMIAAIFILALLNFSYVQRIIRIVFPGF